MQGRSDSIREVLYNPGLVGGHRGGLSFACLADFRSTKNSSGVFSCSQVISRPDHPQIEPQRGKEGKVGKGRRKKERDRDGKKKKIKDRRWRGIEEKKGIQKGQVSVYL